MTEIQLVNKVHSLSIAVSGIKFKRRDGVPKQIVLLTGRIAAGKTTLCDHLRRFDDVHVLKTKEIIRSAALKKLGHASQAERKAMQDFGDELDRETKGQWVRDEVRVLIRKLEANEPRAI